MSYAHLAKSKSSKDEIAALLRRSLSQGVRQLLVANHLLDLVEIVEDLEKAGRSSDPLASARAKLFGKEQESAHDSPKDQVAVQAKLIWKEVSQTNPLFEGLEGPTTLRGHWSLQFRGSSYSVEELLRCLDQRLKRDRLED